jgi:hypothetical protein
MNRAWAALVAVAILAAMVLTLLRRLPHAAPAAPSELPPPPLDSLTVVVREGQPVPGSASFPLGHRLVLTRTNADRRAVRLALAGYEDALPARMLAPGQTACDTLLLDRPGERFAWSIDGAPRGGVAVTGSHLAEGHR